MEGTNDTTNLVDNEAGGRLRGQISERLKSARQKTRNFFRGLTITLTIASSAYSVSAIYTAGADKGERLKIESQRTESHDHHGDFITDED
jgi:hypothetical protein